MSDDKEIKHDELEFSQKEHDELREQGIDDDELDEIVQAVNEELSDNANKKEENDQSQDDKKSGEDDDLGVKKAATNDEYQHRLKNGHHGLIKSGTSKDLNLFKDNEYTDAQQTQDIHKGKDKIAQQEEQKQADTVRTLIAKKHSEKVIDHKDVRINIEAGALPTKTFFIMNGLSAVIAGYGLLANSPAVVIGAMLIAMMLSPITSSALAVIDARLSLLKTSLQTLIGGAGVIYAIGMVLGFLYPEYVMTGEILSRTAPTTMDLVVALAGGAAGAYAMISPNLSVAVVGVAVATALVPPLTASGILLASGHFSLAMGALLLAVTNIFAIQFTNALVLWLFGFRRVMNEEGDDLGQLGQLRQFLKRNVAVLLALLLIGAYLSFNFKHTLNETKFERQSIALIEESIKPQANYLVSSNVRKEDRGHILRVVIQGVEPPSQAQVRELEKSIQKLSDDIFNNRTMKLQIRFVPETIIESSPV